CLEGTRQDILERVRSWEADFEAPNILWINGYPGVGKSAIAATIVEELRSANRLGSSFFFQREKASAMTPSVLWRIVAHDLSRRYPGIRKHLVTTLSMNESCSTTSNVDTLFRELIYEPLTKSDIPAEKLPVIVLDALDECGGVDGRRSDHRKKLMRTLKSWSSLPDGFKLIVTSRRESDIELLFSTVLHHPVEVLAGEDADSSSSSDIRAFLLHELHQLVAQYPSLPSDWPGEKVIAWLIDHARGLFIWIKTVVKLLESGEPRRILRQILSNDVGSMADLYAWILHASFPIPSEDYGRDFCTVLGAIIFTREPLDVANLTHLLSIDSSTMEYICNGLKSVLDCGTIIRIRHQSFVDFLLNSKECPPSFLIDKERERKHLTLCCFNTMKHHLRFNICGLESSYVRNQDVPNLAKRVDECIPLYLSYASRYWASHLVETVPDGNLNDSLQYFMDHQFLWWLETMSLMRQINIGSGMLRSLVSWLRQSNQDDSLATDMQKFVAAFASAMSQSTPHIYISALAFAPRCLEVSKQYLSHYPRTLGVRSGGLQSWPSIQNICTGHQGSVWSVTFSPDGRRIVSGSKDHTIRVWDAETGETVLGPLQGHTSSVYSVSFSPDGKRIVSGSGDHTIRVWDAETGGTVLGPLQGHRSQVTSVSFSPDGKRIVSGSWDRTIRVWDTETGETVLGPLQGHSESTNSVSFSPDGKRIVSGSHDNTIRVWDVETGETVLGPLQGHSDSINSVSFSPDGKRIASGSSDHTIRVWDSETGETVLGPLRGHSDSTNSVSFSPDGKRIVSGSWDRTIRVWDTETGETVLGPLQGHRSMVFSVSFSPDGKRIVSGSRHRGIRVWDAETGQTVQGSLQGHTSSVISVSFSPDGKRIASGSSDHKIRVWDAETGEAFLGPLQGHSDSIRSVMFSPDGKRIVSGSKDHTIRVWDAETGETVLGPLQGHSDSTNSVSFSPDGKRIVSGSGDHTIRVWDAETGETVLGPLQGHSDSINSVSFSPDGKRILSGSLDDTIRVWDAETGETVVGPLDGHHNFIDPVSSSPDGKRIVHGSWDRTIRVWDAETGRTVLGPLDGHSGSINCVSFSPDGKRIASGSSDQTIRVWDAGTGESVLGPLQGHSDSINSVSFSPDGKRIVSGSEDHTIWVWDAAMGQTVVNISQSPNPARESLSPFSAQKLLPSGFHNMDYKSNGLLVSSLQYGWIRGPNSELLFWVPPEIRPRLYRLGPILVIDGRKAWTTLDLEHFVHGKEWSRCKDHRVT
ncbi:hypothetical protein M408DRAFT_66858, partial [Serendipita vermifera MAFF 305830]